MDTITFYQWFYVHIRNHSNYCVFSSFSPCVIITVSLYKQLSLVLFYLSSSLSIYPIVCPSIQLSVHLSDYQHPSLHALCLFMFVTEGNVGWLGWHVPIGYGFWLQPSHWKARRKQVYMVIDIALVLVQVYMVIDIALVLVQVYMVIDIALVLVQVYMVIDIALVLVYNSYWYSIGTGI